MRQPHAQQPRRRPARRCRPAAGAGNDSPRSRIASVTAGLKCAPEIGPSNTISTYRPPAVAAALASKRDGVVSAGQALAHDPAADHDRQQQQGADELGGQDTPACSCGVVSPVCRCRGAAAVQREADRACPAAAPPAVRRDVRRIEKAFDDTRDDARLRRLRLPTGSSTPQCAVVRSDPAIAGQASPAALSQTVMIMSICGASGAANSSQFLLRSRAGVEAESSPPGSAAIGCTLPLGWLPALKAC